MTDQEILLLANDCGLIPVSCMQWNGKGFVEVSEFIDGDQAAMIQFARQLMLVQQNLCMKSCNTAQKTDGCGITIQ
jgi:hypothetical protein